MNHIFNYDGPLFGFLDKVANLFILNILFMICCIPLFTIGASVTALNYMMLKIVRGEEGYIVKDFFKAFKENFKQATAIWLIMAVLGTVFFVDFYVLNNMAIAISPVIRVVIYALLIVWVFELSYVFAVLSRFVNTVKQTMKNALLMSIRHLPWTILIIAVPAVVAAVTYIFMYRMLPVIFIAGFSGIAYIQAFIFSRIFKLYEAEQV
ncbi:MAG: YesL family protein [Lachnospiraceae bacterium]|nr:YesL family protein [Lachnospiraceae bacterium]